MHYALIICTHIPFFVVSLAAGLIDLRCVLRTGRKNCFIYIINVERVDRRQRDLAVPAPALLLAHLPRPFRTRRAYSPPHSGVPFSRPRFPLFRRIERLYHSKEKNQLFFNLIFTYFREIAAALTVTLVFASLNLLVPELIRQFMHFMREKHLQKRQYGDFIGKFLVIQFLRIFFGEHSKRLFHELALKVESTLARKLVSKSLRMAKESRDRIPESEIIQL